MKWQTTAAAVVCVAVLATAALADVSGDWKWSTTFQNQTREQTLRLKQDGDKVTGAMVGRQGRETPIQNAELKDGKLSFSVTRMRGDVKMTVRYSGKVDGDKIVGKIDTERDGQTRSRDWEATRAK